ncbi:MAG: magnesium transporter CorA family protein [Allobaculum sp.]|nr:magnesium transporter CorA family protein [Allobaculum sp.]
MITYYKTDEEGVLQVLEGPERGCWISVVCPNGREQAALLEDFNLRREFLRAALDEEESSYIDRDDDENQTLIIVDYPEEDEDSSSSTIVSYITRPIGFIFTESYLFTICTRPNSTVEQMESGDVKGLDTRYKTRFLLYVLLLISQEYLQDLRRIERLNQSTERQLFKKMQNQALMDMLLLSKSLIYFSTSLKAEELTLRRIVRTRQIPMYEDDKDLLDDVLIEIRQAIEMCTIYSDINARTSDGFSNVINNNMNDIMKRLTVLTLVLSIPNMVYGFYGMNVVDLPLPLVWFPSVLSVVLSLAAWLYFKHNSGYRS